MSARPHVTPRQSAVDEVVTSWPGVHARPVFGQRAYVRGRKMFAFLADAGVSVKAGSPQEAEKLCERDGVAPFVYGEGMEMKGWPVLPLRSDEELDEALSVVRRAYEAAE